jgi:drug/metabolite transporter (DMT)-like permease
VAAIGLALISAVLFGSLSVTLGLAMRRTRDAEAGALVTAVVALAVCGAIALATNDWAGEVWPFLLAGLIAPGGSQLLYVYAVREAGSSRAAVVVGAAPLVSVTIALTALREPLEPGLVVGAVLIVAGGLALAGERDRPQRFRPAGLLLAFGSATLFATRDNLVRWLAEGSQVPPQLAASATLVSGSALIAVYLVARAGRALPRRLAAALRPFAPSGAVWGLSYAALFEAFYRGRVTVVSPLVATEALFGVLIAALLLGRSELIGRHVVAGAVLIVSGGVLIGAFR